MSDGSGDQTLEGAAKSLAIKQTVELGGSDDSNSHAIYGQEVDILTSVVDGVSGSNKVKISPIVSYDWPVKHYYGQQVAVDKSQKYVAYALKSRTNGIVRLIHRQLAERALIKCYTGLVADISFSNSTDQDVLASIEEDGSLYVHSIALDTANHVSITLLLKIHCSASTADLKRVIWGLYVDESSMSEEEEEVDEDKNLNLATVINNKVFVLNVEGVAREHGQGPHEFNEISSSISVISKHTEKVIAANIAPDESAIATASEDGVVYFHSLPNTDLMYTWRPHNGKPLSMLAFLDNLLEPNSDSPYWRYAITGACNNTELKIWTCDKWKCLQTLRFKANSENTEPCILANLDLSSRYLALSDISNRVLYILQIHQDDTAAHFSSLSEFVLGAPILSFAIMSIHRKQLVDISDSEDEEDDEETDEKNGLSLKRGLSVHLTAVQPKNLQDMYVTFTPETCTIGESSTYSDSLSSIAHPVDGLSDLSTTTAQSKDLAASHNTLTAPGDILDVPVDLTSSLNELSLSLGATRQGETPSPGTAEEKKEAVTTPTPVLLTPEAFTSCSTNAINSQLDSLISPASAHSSLTHITHLHDNSSLAAGPAAALFQAGSASTVSSMTLTPKSSVGEELSTSTPDAAAAALPQSPTSAPLPSSKESTPLAAEDTAKQLEELFGSSLSSSGRVVTGPSLSSIPILTEADILKQTPPTSHPTTDNASSPKAPLASAPNHKPSGSRGSSPVALTYDTKIWPQPPQPPFGNEPELSESTGESDESDSSGGTPSPDQVTTDDELNVKDIEQEVAQEDAAAAAAAVRSVARSEKAEGKESVPPYANQLHEQVTSQLKELKSSILSLNEIMLSQGRDLHLLKNRGNSQQSMDKLSKQMQSLSNSISTKLEQNMSSMKREQKQMQERSVSQSVSKLSQELRGMVEKSVTNEIRKSVLPALSQLVEPVKADLHNVMAEKLTAADRTMKESLNKLVSSQATIDKVGQAVGLVVQDVMQTSHRDALAQQVLPSFDSSMRSAFSQLNSAFAEGMKTYMEQVHTNTDQVRTKQMNTQSVVTASCEAAVDSLAQTSQDLQGQLSALLKKEVKQQVTAAIHDMTAQIVGEVRNVIKQEVSLALEGQQMALSGQLEALRSAAATPAPSSSDTAIVKAQLERLVTMKDYEGAFKQALDAVNLSILIYLLGKLPDSSLVFADPCPLSQPLLLSLIQQLSVGLLSPNSQLDLLFDYLSDAIMNLDPHDPVTIQNLGIVTDVKDKLSEFMLKNAKSEHSRTVAAIEKSIKLLIRYASP